MKALATVDDAARETLLQQASKLAMSDYGIIPLHFEVTPWAFKKGLAYRPRVDQYTLATEVTAGGGGARHLSPPAGRGRSSRSERVRAALRRR